MSKPFERRLFDAALVKRALADPEFRRSLLEAPKETYLRELQKLRPGQEIPEEVEIKVVEEHGNVFYLVLPTVPDGARLSQEQYHAIADHSKTHRDPCWGLGDPP